jgi:hypothetical protein
MSCGGATSRLLAVSAASAIVRWASEKLRMESALLYLLARRREVDLRHPLQRRRWRVAAASSAAAHDRFEQHHEQRLEPEHCRRQRLRNNWPFLAGETCRN